MLKDAWVNEGDVNIMRRGCDVVRLAQSGAINKSEMRWISFEQTAAN